MGEPTPVQRLDPTRMVVPRLGPDARGYPDADATGFEERLALFTYSIARERSLALLEMLTEPRRLRARAHARRVASWDSANRQASLERSFGLRSDAEAQLRSLLNVASPPLRAEILKQLPPYLRSVFTSPPAPEAAEPSPAMTTLARRLIREATR